MTSAITALARSGGVGSSAPTSPSSPRNDRRAVWHTVRTASGRVSDSTGPGVSPPASEPLPSRVPAPERGSGHAVEHHAEEDGERDDGAGLDGDRRCGPELLDGEQGEHHRREPPGPEPSHEQDGRPVGRAAQEGQCHRHHPEHREAEDGVEDGRRGEVVQREGSMAAPKRNQTASASSRPTSSGSSTRSSPSGSPARSAWVPGRQAANAIPATNAAMNPLPSSAMAQEKLARAAAIVATRPPPPAIHPRREHAVMSPTPSTPTTAPRGPPAPAPPLPGPRDSNRGRRSRARRRPRSG